MNSHSGKSYKKVTSGKMRQKKSDYVPDVAVFNRYLDSLYTLKTPKTLMRILFNTVTD